MSGADPRDYLVAADAMLTSGGPGGPGAAGDGGWWPKACACLIRLALEASLDAFWVATAPAVGSCRSQRIKLLMLRRYIGTDFARRTAYAWAVLSRMTHYRCHDPAPAAVELRRMFRSVAQLIDELSGSTTSGAR